MNNPLEQTPERIDFSGLKADDEDPGAAQLRIRKGSLADKLDMQYLMNNV